MEHTIITQEQYAELALRLMKKGQIKLAEDIVQIIAKYEHDIAEIIFNDIIKKETLLKRFYLTTNAKKAIEYFDKTYLSFEHMVKSIQDCLEYIGNIILNGPEMEMNCKMFTETYILRNIVNKLNSSVQVAVLKSLRNRLEMRFNQNLVDFLINDEEYYSKN